MKVLFAAGDIGGARALLPVAHLAAAKGMTVMALAHRSFHDEGSEQWQWLSPDQAEDQAKSADVVLYATSVNDPLAVKIAQKARDAGRPILHMLDNWSSYAARIAELVPDAYAVMDDLAYEEAIADGIQRNRLVITGHPGLAKLAQEAKMYNHSRTCEHGLKLFFVSEPAASDGGPEGRGYDEVDVATALFSGIANAGVDASMFTLKVAPHPREDRSAVHDRLRVLTTKSFGAPCGAIVPPNEVRHCLHTSTHVAGMSSILLYEAWLLGRSTLSLQPGLTNSGLRTLSKRDGVLFHSDTKGTEATIAEWLSRPPREPMPDLNQHACAAQDALKLACDLVATSI